MTFTFPRGDPQIRQLRKRWYGGDGKEPPLGSPLLYTNPKNLSIASLNFATKNYGKDSGKNLDEMYKEPPFPLPLRALPQKNSPQGSCAPPYAY
jgi:hypothetical protein